MANPDYSTLLAQIAAETDPVIKQQLIDQCYIFEDPLTNEEKELFEYCAFDYIENNPGYVEAADSSPTGVYVVEGYVADGYINIEDTIVYRDVYVLEGYVDENYIEIPDSAQYSGFVSYVGVYYNNNGETT